MDKVHFPYRSDSHLTFLHVVGESGSWEKHGLQVEYDYFISSEDAHNNVANGSVEFVGGNHLSPYIRRPKGDRWVYLGQSVSLLNHRMVVRSDSGISRVGPHNHPVTKQAHGLTEINPFVAFGQIGRAHV